MATLPPLTQLAGNYGSLFEGYWNQLDINRNGRIDASSAAAFLKKSQLGDPVLHKIWELSDPSGKGYLDQQGFYASLRLISACQLGKEPSLANITLSDPPPRMIGVDSTTIASFAQKKWTIEVEDRARYDKMFQSLSPTGGKLSGDKAKPVMLASKLPVDALGKIWNLSDIDADGKLDVDEFAVAMRLIQLCQAGETLPPSLPPSIIPPTKKAGGTPALTSLQAPLRPSPSPSPTPLSTSGGSSPTLGRKMEWVVTPEVKAKYDKYFEGIDKDRDGMVTGEEARGLFMASNLSSGILAHVWNLCDTQKKGKLNAEQFALAMHLVAEKVRGKELPQELAPNMIPPSLRGKAPPTAAMATSMSSSAFLSTSSVPLAPTVSSTPSLFTSITSTPHLPTMTSTPPLLPTPVPTSGAPTMTPSSSSTSIGFANDFTAIKQLDSISNEIEGIKSEKVKLQEDIRVKQELIQTRKGEIEGLQGEANQYMKQREELEREKGLYQSKLEQVDNEKVLIEGQIAETKQKCQDEQNEIDQLKLQLSQQESSKRAQGEELERLKVQLENLRKEEREYKQKVEAGKAELEKLQKANQNRQNEIREVRHKLDRLKEEQLQLNQQMTMYAPSSTPGSTPSSSVVNINDMGHLSAELHVPHINEPDAISARATAGSSSPVSSISGFSTNSHLEDGGEEGGGGGSGGGGGGSGVGGGGGSVGKEERPQRSDPFAGTTATSTATSQATDPFAAFSLPGGDQFASGGGGGGFKPSDLSAFDPFGMSEAFKSTSISGSSIGEDLFKTDPFSSPGSTPATTNSVSTDPFSGQDPFSSDPFASTSSGTSGGGGKTGGKTSETSSWSGPGLFGSDPFSSGGGSAGGGGGGPSAATPTDPFSSDPFLEDPFGVKSSSGGDTNPFGGGASDGFGSGKGWADSKTS